MNMNKILAAGLIAAVASTASFAECGNGGFYVGLNAGMSFTKAKVKKEAHVYNASSDGRNDQPYANIKFAADDAANAIKVATANARSAAFTSAIKNSNKKTNFAAELVFGYDFRLNDVMMGVDLTFGSNFGKTKLKVKNLNTAAAGTEWADNGEVSGEFANVKEQWHIGLMPRVGYLFTPEFEGYVTFGVKFSKLKLKAPDIADGLDANGSKPEVEPSLKKKSGMRVIPVVGAGVRYEFTPELFAKLEYNFDFRAKAKMHKDTMKELKSVKVSAHVVKLGLGYRF